MDEHDNDRLPRFGREELPESERADFDAVRARWIEDFENWPEHVEGREHILEHFTALSTIPPVAIPAIEACEVIFRREGSPGTLSRADHELVDQILVLDSGYLGLIAWHTPTAIQAGVRIEAMLALADGREQDLTDDERQQVEFVRAVRDGQMTNDIWRRMSERLGSDRGVVDYVSLVLLLVFQHRFAWALGVRPMGDQAWRTMLGDFAAGRRGLADFPLTAGSADTEAVEAVATACR